MIHGTHRIATSARLMLAVVVALGVVVAGSPAVPRAASSGASGWSTHTLGVSTVGGRATSKHAQLCDMAVRANGTVIASWHTVTGEGFSGRTVQPTTDRAFVAEKRPGGSWSAAKLLWSHQHGIRGRTTSRGVYASCPQIALGAGNSLDVIWDQHTETPDDPKHSPFVHTGPFSIRHRLRSGGRWFGERVVVANGAYPTVTSEGSGRALVEFLGRHGETAILRRVDGSWGSQATIAQPHYVTEFRAAFDGRGTVTIVWLERHAPMARRADSSGHWGPTQALPSNDCGFDSQSVPNLASDGRGTVAVAWSCKGRDGNSIQVATDGAYGQPTATLDLTAPTIGADGRQQRSAERTLLGVQFDGAGTAHLAWFSSPFLPGLGSPLSLRVSALVPGGSWQPPAEIYTLPESVNHAPTEIEAAAQPDSPDSDYFALARSGHGAVAVAGYALRVLERRADGSWKAPMTLDSAPASPIVRAGGNQLALGWTSYSKRGVVVATAGP